MRTFSILAVIAAMATPAFAHRDLNESPVGAQTTASAQVEKAAFISFAGFNAAYVSNQNNVVDRNR